MEAEINLQSFIYSHFLYNEGLSGKYWARLNFVLKQRYNKQTANITYKIKLSKPPSGAQKIIPGG